MKRNYWMAVLLLMLVMLLFYSCVDTAMPYSLRQSTEHIVAVRFLNGQKFDDASKTYEIITQMELEQGLTFIEELRKIECRKAFPLDTPVGFGEVIVEITYANGEVEMIGCDNNGWITPDGQWEYDSYYFDLESFYALLSQYVDESYFPVAWHIKK